MKKKLICLFVVLVLVFCSSVTAFAADNAPVLTLDKNQYNENGERHIKITWEGASKAYIIELDDNKYFSSPITKNREVYHIRKNGKFYNFVLSENVDATYYIRVRTVDNMLWSNVVIADIENNKNESENKPYFNIPKLPDIPKLNIKFDFSYLFKKK